MRIELNGLQLDCEEQGGEGRSVTSICTVESRNTAAYDAPGGQSSTFGDLGRGAVKIVLEGLASGKSGPAFLEGIWACFKKGDPVEFNSDLSGAADITKVLIDSMVVKTAAGNKNRFDYYLELIEYREPPEEPEGPIAGERGETGEEGEAGAEGTGSGETSAEAREWAEQVAEESALERNDLAGNVLAADGRPAKNTTVIISGQGREIEVQTDDNGEYQVGDLAPGYYKVTAGDSEAQYVSVGQSGEENEEDLKAIEAELDEIEKLVAGLENDVRNYKALNDYKKAKGRALTLKDRIGILVAKVKTIKSAAGKLAGIRSRIQSIKEHLENIVTTTIEKQIEQLDIPGNVPGAQPEVPNTAETETTVEEQVEEAYEEAEETVEETVDEVADDVEDAVDEVVDTVEDTAEGVGNAVDEAYEDAEEAIDELLGSGDEEGGQ